MQNRLPDTNQPRRAWLYVGGVLGPFGGGVLNPMIPELREAFGVSTNTVAWGFTGYLLPFAVLLLVSGTLGTRWGVARSLRFAFALYVPATLFCVIAPNFAWFMVGRVVQGSLNAFMTPLLIASLTENIEPSRLGRVVGSYAAFQSLGQIMAPLLGGVSADIDWRLVFVLVALVSALVAVKLPPASGVIASKFAGQNQATGSASAGPNLRALLRRPTLLLGATALAAAAGPLNVVPLVSLTARDELGLSGGATGLLLLAGTGSAMVLVQPWGKLSDAWGVRRAIVAALVLSGLFVVVLGTVNSVLALTLMWVLTGASIQFVVVGFQLLAANADSTNRGGVISFTLSHRFFGHSLGTLIWVPVFTASPSTAYTASALVAVLAIAAVLASGLGKMTRSNGKGPVKGKPAA